MQTQVLAVALKVTEMRSGPGEEETELGKNWQLTLWPRHEGES